MSLFKKRPYKLEHLTQDNKNTVRTVLNAVLENEEDPAVLKKVSAALKHLEKGALAKDEADQMKACLAVAIRTLYKWPENALAVSLRQKNITMEDIAKITSAQLGG